MSTPDDRIDLLGSETTELPIVRDRPEEADRATSAVLRVTRRPAGAQRVPRAPVPPAPAVPPDAPDAEPPAGDPRTPARPEDLAGASFPSAWRGYEPSAVDAYVRQVGRTIGELRSAQSPREAVQRALERVGEETAAILREAEQAAERMTDSARLEAGERIEAAEREANEITSRARTRLRELDQDIDRIWLERQRLIEDTRQLAAGLARMADQAEARFPAEDEATGPTALELPAPPSSAAEAPADEAETTALPLGTEADASASPPTVESPIAPTPPDARPGDSPPGDGG